MALRAIDCMPPMLAAMKGNPSTCALLLAALTSMASAPEIVEKAYEAKLVQFVLELLASGLERCEDPSTVKAHAVKLLKKLAMDPRLGPAIQVSLPPPTPMPVPATPCLACFFRGAPDVPCT